MVAQIHFLQKREFFGEEFVQSQRHPNYWASRSGMIVSTVKATPALLSQKRSPKGYFSVQFNEWKKITEKRVHRFILEVFVGSCPEGMEGRHLNGNPADNRLDNLAWGTHTENIRDKFRHGTFRVAKGVEAGGAILTEDQVRRIKFGSERCCDLASEFGVSRPTVTQIRKGKTWAHITC